jgi:hypothetical protein
MSSPAAGPPVAAGTADGPATLVLSRTVLAGHEQAFEAVLLYPPRAHP